MAQLSDDCFAFGGALMSLEAAQALIAARLFPVTAAERVALGDADGRVLAHDVVAGCALPPFANSAVDGWAVRAADLQADGQTLLPIRGRIPAGGDASGISAAGCAVRVLTGAPMPADADMVFMQEDVRETPDGVALPAGLKRGANMRPAGEDIAVGARALAAGRRLAPFDLALLAAIGCAEVDVRARLRVALFSTGDEVCEPGAPLGPAAIYDANRAALAAMLTRAGAAVTDGGIIRDEPATMRAALRAAARGHDLIITSGGVSTGEEDHVKGALDQGAGLNFWRVGIKPGRPVVMGVVDGAPLVGLPGNPVAAFVTFVSIVRPVLARLAGEDWRPPTGMPVRLAFAYAKKRGRREFVRVHLRAGADGAPEAVKFAKDGAGIITSLTQTDGLIALDEAATRIEAGAIALFTSYAALLE